MQDRLQRAAREWHSRIPLSKTVRDTANARLKAMVVALDAIGVTTTQKFLNPRRDPNDDYMPSGETLIRFCAAADISLDWLVRGVGTMRLSKRREGATADDVAEYIRETLVAEAELEVANAKDVVTRIEAEARRAFVNSSCRYVGENALALIVDQARDDVRTLRHFESIFAVQAYARQIRGYSSADNLRSVATNMDRRATQLMATVPTETKLVEFATDPAGAPRVRRRA